MYHAKNILNGPMRLTVLFVGMHVVAITAFPSHAMAVSYFFMLISPLAAAVGCFRIARGSWEAIGWEWAALGTAVLVWEAGLVIAAWQDLLQQNNYLVTSLDGFVYFLFGVPLLLIICASPNGTRLRGVILIDALMASAIGILAYSEIFAHLPSQSLTASPLSPTTIALVYDAENGLLAALASIRLLAADSGKEQMFLRTVCKFLWAYTIASCFYNHLVEIRWQLSTGNRLDGVIDVPFLFLAATAWGAQEASDLRSRIAKKSTMRIIQGGISLSLPLTLLGLGILAFAHSAFVAAVSIVGSLLGYGFRNTLFHAHLLESEEALLESRNALEAAALIDPLTGVGNRRAFDRMLEQEWHRKDRAKEPLGMLFVDIDYFKRVNDTYGHQRGDECLAAVAGALKTSLPRAGDFIARYGGEEFACILPATDEKGALAVAERLRSAVEALQIENGQSEFGILTISIGATACRGLTKVALRTMVATADEALYAAKRNGRNRVEFALTGSKWVGLRAS
jgi:diguanylate cyclase (GGDEF)-like protein